jgi:hypothetical protein
MMELITQQLLRLEIRHNYYRNNRCRDLVVRPSSATAALLRKWGVMCRWTDDGMVLLCETRNENGIRVPARLPSGPFKLVFLLTVTGAQFVNFTDLPLSKGGSVYLNNLSDNPSGDDLLLHPADHVSLGDRTDIRPLQFTLPLSDTGSSTKIKVTSDTGGVMMDEEIPAGSACCNIDLAAGGEGIYFLEVNGEKTPAFFALGIERGTVMGVVELFSDPRVPAAYRMLHDEGTLASPAYTVQFNSRATTWTYYIQGNDLGKYGKMSVGSIKSNVTFEGPEQVTLLDGKPAIAFYSADPIPLAERPELFFQLKKNGGTTNGSVLVDALPAPGANMIKPSGDGKIQSEVYVYL